MSTHSKPKSRRQMRHPASRCKSHAHDKQQGEARQETAWLGVKAPERPSPQRNFRGLAGHEYRYDGARWQRCENPEEFADYVEAEGERRSWFMDHTQRRGVPVTMKRRVAPLDVLTTSFAPWLSDWTATELATGRDPRPKLARIRNRWLQAAQAALSDRRYILGYAFHADTDDLHFDLVISRQNGAGGRIGEPGLLLVGPWCSSTDRQIRAGATINAEKRSQLHRSAANFRRRYGNGAKPLDVVLARALDTAAETVLGAVLTPHKAAYAAKVPEMERRHMEAKLATLDAAREKLLRQTAPMPSSPSMPDPMPGPETDFPIPGR